MPKMAITTSAWVAVLAATLVAGCVAEPTRVREADERPFATLVDKAGRPLKLTDLTVILDVRSRFDYGLSHVRGALHLPWTALAKSEATGEPSPDMRKVSQRLSLLGLGPATPVVVVGYGNRGQGEEGRLAWNLVYLGFGDVQVASVDHFRADLTNAPTPAPANAAEWVTNPRPDLIFRDEWGSGGQGRHILALEGFRPAKTDFAVHELKWTDFFTSREGRPNPKVVQQLGALGVRPDDMVVIAGGGPVRSAAAAYALMALGYSRVQVYFRGNP